MYPHEIDYLYIVHLGVHDIFETENTRVAHVVTRLPLCSSHTISTIQLLVTIWRYCRRTLHNWACTILLAQVLQDMRNHENLVDPASSHMLVSKVKPCMCVYNFLYDATANSSIIQLSIVHTCNFTWIPVVILELILEPESVVRE